MAKCLISTFDSVLRVPAYSEGSADVSGSLQEPGMQPVTPRHNPSSTYRKTESFTASLYMVAMEQGILIVCLSCV